MPNSQAAQVELNDLLQLLQDYQQIAGKGCPMLRKKPYCYAKSPCWESNMASWRTFPPPINTHLVPWFSQRAKFPIENSFYDTIVQGFPWISYHFRLWKKVFSMDFPWISHGFHRRNCVFFPHPRCLSLKHAVQYLQVNLLEESRQNSAMSCRKRPFFFLPKNKKKRKKWQKMAEFYGLW